MEKYEIVYILICTYVFIGFIISRSSLNTIYSIVNNRNKGNELNDIQRKICNDFDASVSVIGYKAYNFFYYLFYVILWLPILFKNVRNKKKNKI